MSESSAWATLRGNLYGHIQRFEDKLTGGIPDSYVKLGPMYPGGVVRRQIPQGMAKAGEDTCSHRIAN